MASDKGYNDVTGQKLISKTPTDAYREGWDRIFANKKNESLWKNPSKEELNNSRNKLKPNIILEPEPLKWAGP